LVESRVKIWRSKLNRTSYTKASLKSQKVMKNQTHWNKRFRRRNHWRRWLGRILRLHIPRR